MSDYTKPLPRGEDLNGEFYQFCRQHELRFQRCDNCQHWRHMPRASCPHCQSLNWSWQCASGKGKVFSWTVSHRALNPGFADELPYASVIVEMEEGVRMVSNLVDIDLNDLRIDLPVQVFFEDVDDNISLPKFRPVAPC